MTAREGRSRDLSSVRAFCFDMDGTFFVSERLMPRALEVLAEVRHRGWPYVFLTNNSSARAAQYRDKLALLGIDVELREILTSGEATVQHLLRRTSHRSVFLMGTPSLEDEFREAGFRLVDGRSGSAPECVVLGFDKTMTYDKLTTGCLLVARGLPYFATHPDCTCITADGLIPDTGAFIAAIEKVTHRLPHVIGKPRPEMAAAALERLGSHARETAIVGDQLDTDMVMARESGLFGVLVLSGETSRARLESQQTVRPDLVLENVGQLLDHWGK